ncbi:RAMP superfamily CRISPR-associated protein [Thermoanaerobacterium sp. RBIITD]|uniref:RAMP superfamily CRISPR-associated protein n=1 Tax=Thermoanaerobacterium sp. RBIITD TaxID=1550240 RepID=UPI000BB69BD9|nr:RAMP superfamily CRISPR-associated protein [Thermoanaerobacterium sp. RBIITD]
MMAKYLTYDIEALEDIKLAKTNVQIDSQESMEYITGSAIRGAFIYEYIKKNSISDINQGIHKEKLLKGGIKFLNAYPVKDKYDERSIPFPKCYFAPKNDIKSFERYLELKLGIDNKLDPGFERIRIAEFSKYDNGEYDIVKVKKKSNLHINKSRNKNNLFRYDSIKRGQLFKGIIKVEDEAYVDEVIELFNDAVIYIGGSKGSGYGKCKITNMKSENDNPEYLMFRGKYDFEDYIYLYAMSDIIYRNELGEYKTFIEPEYIREKLNLKKVVYIDSSIETKPLTNFNNKWNCRTPQIVGIKAGSIFKYKIEGEINEEVLKEFVDRGIGEKKADGFGRVVLLDDIEEISKLKSYGDENDTKSDLHELLERLRPEDEKQLKDMVTMIFKKRVEDKIAEKVLDIDNDLEGQKELRQSQWGNYKDLFTEMLYKEPYEGIKYYQEFIENIKTKGSASKNSSYKQLSRIKYRDRDFVEFLNDFVVNSNNVDSFYSEAKVKRIEIGKIKSDVDEKFVYQMNLKVLIGLCQYQIRKEDDK